MQILTFLVGLMAYWVPPTDDLDLYRYQGIARDAMQVSEEKEVLDGLDTVEHAIIILSIASFESRYSAAMDAGIKRGDGGQSVCLGAIRVPHDTQLREKIAHDRKECFRRILRRVRYSWNECIDLPFQDRLSKYITGTCVTNHKYSRLYSTRILSGFNGWGEYTF